MIYCICNRNPTRLCHVGSSPSNSGCGTIRLSDGLRATFRSGSGPGSSTMGPAPTRHSGCCWPTPAFTRLANSITSHSGVRFTPSSQCAAAVPRNCLRSALHASAAYNVGRGTTWPNATTTSRKHTADLKWSDLLNRIPK